MSEKKISAEDLNLNQLWVKLHPDSPPVGESERWFLLGAAMGLIARLERDNAELKAELAELRRPKLVPLQEGLKR